MTAEIICVGTELLLGDIVNTNAQFLSRELAERRIFPAIDVAASGTRREELLLDPKSLERAHALRQATADLPTTKQIEVVRELLQRGI